jgi:hypothetical protein
LDPPFQWQAQAVGVCPADSEVGHVPQWVAGVLTQWHGSHCADQQHDG